MAQWQRRRVLIWGKTRPEISQKYREIVCTGGVFEDTRRLVRLYPIPLRFLDDEKYFAQYQWVTVDVARPTHDSRPESWRVKYDTIEVGDKVGTDDATWRERAAWVLQPENIFGSVEQLQARQEQDRTSLGLVQPAEILGVHAHSVPPGELGLFHERYEQAVAQMQLGLEPEREIKPLKPCDYRFTITFRCNDSACSGRHTFSVLDWGVEALYTKMCGRKSSHDAAAEATRERLLEICGPTKDFKFFLGNISNHPKMFTIVGLWYPKKNPQMSLF